MGLQSYWKCSICGFSYSTRAYSRGAQGTGCPKCAKQNRGNTKSKNTAKINNFADKFPKIAKEWHPTKNGNSKPQDFIVGSGKKVWWKCSKGHEWQATIKDRNRGRGCPYCSRRKLLKGYNDLQTVNPALAKDWNYERNNGLTPIPPEKSMGLKCLNRHIRPIFII